jgi:hypothetical protein
MHRPCPTMGKLLPPRIGRYSAVQSTNAFRDTISISTEAFVYGGEVMRNHNHLQLRQLALTTSFASAHRASRDAHSTTRFRKSSKLRRSCSRVKPSACRQPTFSADNARVPCSRRSSSVIVVNLASACSAESRDGGPEGSLVCVKCGGPLKFGPASTRTTLYSAPQVGHAKDVVLCRGMVSL